MPINVVCPSCRSRFSVNEKFAGKEGPCPKCKQKIKIPKLEEQVVIHAPEPEKGKDKTGRPLLTPTKREVTRFNPLVAGVVIGIAVAAFGVAFALRSTAQEAHGVPLWAAIAALAVMGPLLAFAGYSFLRDDEIEPYPRNELWLRVAGCALLYGLLWGAFYLTYPLLAGIDEYSTEPPELYHWLWVGVIFAGLGTFVAWATLELEPGNAFFHFALYLLVLMLLRFTMGLSGAYQFKPAERKNPAPKTPPAAVSLDRDAVPRYARSTDKFKGTCFAPAQSCSRA
jgi:hypothetical protein